MSSILEGTNKAYSQDNTSDKMPGSFSSGPNTPLFEKTASLKDDTYHDNLVANTNDRKEPSYLPMQNNRPEKRGTDHPMDTRHHDASFRSNVINSLSHVNPRDEDLDEEKKATEVLDDQHFMPVAPEQHNGSSVLSGSKNNNTNTNNDQDAGFLQSTLSKISTGLVGSNNDNKQGTTDVTKTVSSGVQSAKSAVTEAVNSLVAPLQGQSKQPSNDERVDVKPPSTLDSISNKIADTLPSLTTASKPADQLDEVAQRVQKDDHVVSTPALSDMEKQVDSEFNGDTPLHNSDHVKAFVDQDRSLPPSIDNQVNLETTTNQPPLVHEDTQPKLRSMTGGVAPIPQLPATRLDVGTPSEVLSDASSMTTERSGIISPPPSLSSGLVSNTATPATRPMDEYKNAPISNVTTPAYEPSMNPLQDSSDLPSHEPRSSLSSGSQIPAVLSGAAAGSALQSGSEIRAAGKSTKFELPAFNKEHSGWTPDVEVPEFTQANGDDDVDIPVSTQQRGSDASNTSSMLGSFSLSLDKLKSGLGFLSSPQEANEQSPKEQPRHMKDVDVPGSVDDNVVLPVAQNTDNHKDTVRPLPVVNVPKEEKEDDVDVAEDQNKQDEPDYGYAKIMLPPQTKSEQQLLSDKNMIDSSNSSSRTDNISTTATIGTEGPREPKFETRGPRERTDVPLGALSSDAPRIPSIEKLTASGSNVDRLSDDIERKLDDMSISRNHQSTQQGPVEDSKHYSMPAHVKSVIYHDHAAEDALKSTLNGNEDGRLKVRKGFENFNGFGVECVPSSNDN